MSLATTSRVRPRRTRWYTIGALVFVFVSIGGYFGFRAYIYGDDAPSIPVVDSLGS